MKTHPPQFKKERQQYHHNEPIPVTSILASQNNEQHTVTKTCLPIETHETPLQLQFTTPEVYQSASTINTLHPANESEALAHRLELARQ
ncbi:20771_t:CDS:2 [Cetraspora pellucida]|uniref:20771_t:CDS:1 n=1 Tax=Cetraspora pellucida TaxID=1433469 RepID=A0A9N9PC56_9GLOM|nr:20771_t:CDS:2 [Cetraspora pellucida]